MIVVEPPYDLVALFSDLEMQKLFEVLLERGQIARRSCARSFRWRSLRDPRRDTVWTQPERPLAPFLRLDCRFLIVWDHQGSGTEDESPRQVEGRVVARLESAGIEAERVLAVALDPELECLFRSVWPKVKSTIAQERKVAPPEDSLILAEAQRSLPKLPWSDEFEEALDENPKEIFEALIRLVKLRRAAPLYAKVAEQVSLPLVKKESAAERIALRIASWFPPI